MKAMVLIGLTLVLIGIVSLGYGGFTYLSRDTVADIGPVQISADRAHTVWIPPIAGLLMLGTGVLLVAMGNDAPRRV